MEQLRLEPTADFCFGQIEACRVIEEFVLEQERRGKQYWSAEQVYSTIRSVRLNLEEKMKKK